MGLQDRLQQARRIDGEEEDLGKAASPLGSQQSVADVVHSSTSTQVAAGL